MKRYRVKKKGKNNDLFSTGISLFMMTLFCVITAEGKNNGLLNLMLLIDFIVIITWLITFLLKKWMEERKHQRYLKSSLYKIDKMGGKEFEKFLASHFKKQGYKVSLTPASNDYGADLILEKDNERVAVQAKRYNGKVSNSAIQEVSGAMMYYKCSSGMVITNSFFTKNAIHLAKECSITLWDREDLRKNFQISE